MPLQSQLFKGDRALEACAVQDSAHIQLGAFGQHVGKIQTALFLLDRLDINAGELSATRYGQSTADGQGFRRFQRSADVTTCHSLGSLAWPKFSRVSLRSHIPGSMFTGSSMIRGGRLQSGISGSRFRSQKPARFALAAALSNAAVVIMRGRGKDVPPASSLAWSNRNLRQQG